MSEADLETLQARAVLRERMIDPLWLNAHRSEDYTPQDLAAVAKIQAVARQRVRGYLADRLDMAYGDCVVERFDLATCRRAWRALQGRTYSDIRAWYKLTRSKTGPKPERGTYDRDSAGGRT